jgi:hypothetical protein
VELSAILSAVKNFNLLFRELLLRQFLYIMGSSRGSLGIPKD